MSLRSKNALSFFELHPFYQIYTKKAQYSFLATLKFEFKKDVSYFWQKKQVSSSP